MTHLSSPVASSTADFQPKTMADIIDSLKRLERVGSENSKTTEKLIQAAAEVSSKIVTQFHLTPGETVRIPGSIANEASALATAETPPLDYLVRDGKLFNQSICAHVAQNRTAALRFAEDIAENGLLDVIIRDLGERAGRSNAGLTILEAASSSVPSVLLIPCLRELMKNNEAVRVSRMPPEHIDDTFRVKGLTETFVELRKDGSGFLVYIPIARIKEILAATPVKSSILILSAGAVEWVETPSPGYPHPRWEYTH
jgi:hypothetical protein